MKAVKIITEQDYIDVYFEDGRAVRIEGKLQEGRFWTQRCNIREWKVPEGGHVSGSERQEIVVAVIDKSKDTPAPVKFRDSVYYGRFSCDGEMIAAGKFIDSVLCLYWGKDKQFHFNMRYQDQYNEGEFDEISDEEFEEFKAEMDAYWANREDKDD